MRKHGIVLILGSLLMAAPVLVAQTPAAPAPASTPASNPKAKSKAEAVALTNLAKLAKTPTTTPAQMDAALTDFVTRFPTSEFLASVNVMGLQFFQDPSHSDYARSLVYGEQALKANPNEMYALITLGSIIPENVHSTDLDEQQRLAEATAYNQKAIQLAEQYAAAGTANGRPFTQQTKDQIEASAYSALADIAKVKKDYPAVVANYAKAIPLDDPAHQAQDYFYTARAQIEMKQYPQALASLDAADKAAPGNLTVQNAVESNRKEIQQLQAAAGKPAAH